ncbi:MAG: cysteine sulfinate desulfinase [Bacteroidetes bacterium GWC2_33_15]|nr:MAG: cysteine sulfinate desulfinase [Bacteroidetes bacterium GWA2_33_15]OFX51999.1 MAG: cysteine sulfinate desulfinase [Bacteroidetes bacterium GWC2_33_15]OFX63829.1 MAG: cysteine sulfinate desulfinase [Bacteroidetes bacterium GWB2_32_14]OFX67402.1 MAG: cysteine sulfinate desulfinase [Bacteroidetes bacterium GWD2_33_33]HAN17835.1 cysteine desulfurase CsdA [Bacteroidales bacterium]
MSLNIHKIRNDFPILNQEIYGKPLVYFDNGATTQKPRIVIDEELKIYLHENSNIHRGVHYLSEQLTQRFEDARKVVQNFIQAKSEHEILFTSGTTQSINTVAYSFGERFVFEDDEIIISSLEHHSNIVPWQLLCERKKAKLKIIPVNDEGELLIDELQKLISPKTKIISVTQVSNALGSVIDVKKIIEIAHNHNIPVLIDGAQSIQHGRVDVQDLDCDFFVFSGHKLYGPTGIGVLYGKEKWLNKMPPFLSGGEMIKKVTFDKTTFNELPFKFEAGTPNYVGAIGLAKAIEYIQSTGIEEISAYEKELLTYATEKLNSIKGLKIIGTSGKKVSLISFILENIHHYDAGMIIDKMGIAVRTGHHCAEPVMQRFGIEGTIRASFSFYNTKEEIDKLYYALLTVKQMFG